MRKMSAKNHGKETFICFYFDSLLAFQQFHKRISIINRESLNKKSK
jgi:hypothetical protein